MIIATTIAVAALLCAGPDDARAERWVPADHPASFARTITAFTSPSRKLDVASEFPGRVLEVAITEGARVPGERGRLEVVVRLDSRFATIARDRAATALVTAERSEVQSRKRLALAQREQTYRDAEVERIRDLARNGRVRSSDLDAVVFEADRAALEVESREAALALASTAVTAARHDLDEAEERLARHEIRAPAGWIVLERRVEPGAMVLAGEALLVVADVATLSVETRLSEEEVRALPRDGVDLEFRHGNGVAARARVHRIDVDHNPATLKRLVELRLPGDAAPAETGGLEVTFSLSIPDPAGSLLVHEDFVTHRHEQAFVQLDDGRRLPILPLRRQNDHWLISRDALPADASLIRP